MHTYIHTNREYEESEESFYFNFYSKFHQYSQQDSNLLRILPHYTYIHHVSRPYNQWTMEHKNNNASLLKASIPTDMVHHTYIHTYIRK